MDYLETLLLWPARLETFTLGDMNRFGFCRINIASVWSALIPHMATLKSIRIGSVANQANWDIPPPDVLSGVSFTRFECLTFLSLSYWNTGYNTAYLPGLMAPCLQTFEWTFDRTGVYLDMFQGPEEEFLYHLASTARQGGIPLRQIAIDYVPHAKMGRELFGGTRYQEAELKYPWDCMIQLKRLIHGLRIDLTYNQPTVTREEFEVALLEYKQANERGPEQEATDLEELEGGDSDESGSV